MPLEITIPLREISYAGKTGAVLFEVLSMPQGVTFNIPVEGLSSTDQHFAKEWGQKTENISSQEQEQVQTPEPEAEQNDLAEAAARAKKVAAGFERALALNKIKLVPLK